MDNLYVYLPCYNEAGNIESLVTEWISESESLLRERYRLHIVCVDDKSTDGTLEILNSLARVHKQIKVIPHSTNQNLGGVLNTSISDFLQAAEKDDVLCFMDADNTHKPAYVHAMLEKLRAASSRNACVIASRYQPGSGVQGLTKHRAWFSDLARIYCSLVLRVPNVRDYTCGYRVYTRQALILCRQRYGEAMVENRSFACMMELLCKLCQCGCEFAEIPFQLHYDDKAGESKMRLGTTIRDSLFTALKLRFSDGKLDKK